MVNIFVILYLSFMVFVFWSNIMCMLNFMRLFFTLGGGFGWSCCCGFGGWGGLFSTIGIKCWLFEMYFGLSVRAGGCFVQGFGQFGVQLG